MTYINYSFYISQVAWVETGAQFSATITNVFDGHVSVLYDDTVDDKLCYENNVSLSRIKTISRNDTDNREGLSRTQLSSSVPSSLNVLQKLMKVNFFTTQYVWS